MRCYCCDCELTDYESSLKNPATGEYHDTCIRCLRSANIPYTGNKVLKQKNREVVEKAWEELNFDEDTYGRS